MLEKKQEGLHCALDLSCELDSLLDKICSVFEPKFIVDQLLVFLKLVAVHLGNPVKQSVVVGGYLGCKNFVSILQLLA